MAKKRKKRSRNKPAVTQVSSETVAAKIESNPSSAESHSRIKRFTQWCMGTIVGILLLGVIGNHISAVIPNPFQLAYSYFWKTSEKPIVWYAAGVKNEMKHEISVGIWSNTQANLTIYTLKPEEIKWFTEDAPIYMIIKGDIIAEQTPNIQFFYTYEGEEAYELKAKTFDQKPTDDELKSLKPNKIIEIYGADEPKIISFVDGTKISFEVYGPRNEELNIALPVMAEGKYIYPFQVQDSKK